MFTNKRIIHNSLPVLFQNLFKVVDVIVLISGHQVGHGQDLGVVLVRFGLLGIEGIDVRLHQHIGQDQVLETSGSAWRPRLVVVLERLEEISVRFLEFHLTEMHFAAAFTNHAQDDRMRNGRLDVQRLVVQRLQLFVVFLSGVHLDLQGVNLQQLRPFLQVVLALLRSATRMQLLQDP